MGLGTGVAAHPDAWTLALGGDVMLNGVPIAARPFSDIAQTLRDSDLSVVNLEIPLTSARSRTARKSEAAIRAKTQYVLRADPNHIGSLAASGIDAVSLGNNHAMDFGVDGLTEMTGLLERKGIRWTGAGVDLDAASKPVELSAPDGQRVKLVSFLAFRSARGAGACTPAGKSSSGVAWLGLPNVDAAAKKHVQAIVSGAKSAGEMLVVALHWGEEKHTLPNAYQVSLGRAFVDAGADVVVGHHPHVLQGGELYKGKPILYSTGNLVSSRPGTTAIFVLAFRGAAFASIELSPCRISGGKAVLFDAKRAPDAVNAWKKLGERLRKAYPNKNSQALGP